LKSNTNAIKFYENLGFSYLFEEPLYKEENEDGFVLSTREELVGKSHFSEDIRNPEDYFITMEYK